MAIPLWAEQIVLSGEDPEDLRVIGTPSGSVLVQDMTGFSGATWEGGAHLWWAEGGPGDRLELQFDIAEAGTYGIAVQLTQAGDYAIVELALDGTALGGPIDLYMPEVTHTGFLELGTQDLASGAHTLTIDITGKNAAAQPGYMVGLDAFRLTQTGEAVPSAIESEGVSAFTTDFESGDLTGWTQAGLAFGGQPTLGDNPTARDRGQPSNHEGDWWIGTYERYQGKAREQAGDEQGDALTGTLTSAPFLIQGNEISFLVGGGHHLLDDPDGPEVVALIVGGSIVRSTTGADSETMSRATWDVAEYASQEAQLHIIDGHTGDWGHINCDDFRMTLDGVPVAFLSMEPTSTIAEGPSEVLGTLPMETSGTGVAGLALYGQTIPIDFFDGFDRALAPQWTWVNEDASAWRLTDDGKLEIDLSRSSYYEVDEGRNVLLAEAPFGDFTVETRLTFEPVANFQFAGIVLMADNENHITYGRQYAELPRDECLNCKGNAITQFDVAGGDYEAAWGRAMFVTVPSTSEAYLRIDVEGDGYTILHSEDGETWSTFNFGTLAWTPTHVGLFTATGDEPVDGVSAQFDSFLLQSEIGDIDWAQPSAEQLARWRAAALRRSAGSGLGISSSGVCWQATWTAYGDYGAVVYDTTSSPCLCGDEWDDWLNVVGPWLDSIKATHPDAYVDSSDFELCGGSCFRAVLIAGRTADSSEIARLISPCFADVGAYYDWEEDVYVAWTDGIKAAYPGIDIIVTAGQETCDCP